MAAVMVREVFEIRPPDRAAPTRPATPPRRVAAVRPPRASGGDAVVVDLQERRTRSVFDAEPEAVLRRDVAVPVVRGRRPSVLGPSSEGRHVDRGPTRVGAEVRSRRRAWLVVVAVALAIVGVAVTDDPAGGRLGGRGDVASTAPVAAVPTISIVVQPGDTLWSIATALVGDGDPRALVDELQAAHGGAELHPGDVITIPAP
jgi:hypothetical protein